MSGGVNVWGSERLGGERLTIAFCMYAAQFLKDGFAKALTDFYFDLKTIWHSKSMVY